MQGIFGRGESVGDTGYRVVKSLVFAIGINGIRVISGKNKLTGCRINQTPPLPHVMGPQLPSC